MKNFQAFGNSNEKTAPAASLLPADKSLIAIPSVENEVSSDPLVKYRATANS